MRAKTVETLTDQAFTGAPTAIDALQCLVRFHDSPQKSLRRFSAFSGVLPNEHKTNPSASPGIFRAVFVVSKSPRKFVLVDRSFKSP